MNQLPAGVSATPLSPSAIVIRDLLRLHNLMVVLVVAAGLAGHAAHEFIGGRGQSPWVYWLCDGVRVIAPLAALALVMHHTNKVSSQLAGAGQETPALDDEALLAGFRSSKQRTIVLFAVAGWIAAVAMAVGHKRVYLILIPLLLLINVRPRQRALESFAAVIGSLREEEQSERGATAGRDAPPSG